MIVRLGKRDQKLIDELVLYFKENHELFVRLLNSFKGIIDSSKKLNELAHSVKSRIKNPDHLRDKLERKLREAKGRKQELGITKENLFEKVNDLVGFRIIHLHTKQYEEIDAELKKIFAEQQWILLQGPTARTWDDEYREYFESIGTKVDKSPNLYTSVHYIIKPNSSASLTCEIQVRTLMEEVWGEVDHTINYPDPTESFSCREQIKALARATSSCSRLVDSIFSTFQEHNNTKNSQPQNSVRKKPLKNKGKK